MQPTSTITKGLIISLVSIAVSLAVYFSGVDLNSPVRWLSYCILLAGVIISIIQYGKQIDHNATFGNYFAHGFKISATVAVFMIIYIVVFVMLFPEFKEKGLEEARKSMDQNDKISEDQKIQAIETTKKLFMVLVIGATLIYNLVMGAIGALIGAAVTKKNPRPLEEIN
jgi:hypothetical protein